MGMCIEGDSAGMSNRLRVGDVKGWLVGWLVSVNYYTCKIKAIGEEELLKWD